MILGLLGGCISLMIILLGVVGVGPDNDMIFC